MPIYEYQCQACGKELEVSQRITEPALTDCPECHKPQLQRLISATSFHLKGGGWYKDGYGQKGGTDGKRTDNDRIDRLSKAVDDDKKKTEAPAASSDAGSSSAGSSSAGSSSAGSSGGSSDKAA